jgi:hypothetical protein
MPDQFYAQTGLVTVALLPLITHEPEVPVSATPIRRLEITSRLEVFKDGG